MEHKGGTLNPSVGVKQLSERMILELRWEGSEGVRQRKWGRAKHRGKEKKLVQGTANAKALRWQSAC